MEIEDQSTSRPEQQVQPNNYFTNSNVNPRPIFFPRAHSDGNFRISSSDDGVCLSGEPFSASLDDMGSEDDLLSAFLDLQKLGRNEDDDSGAGYLILDRDDGAGDCGGGGEYENGFRLRHRHNRLPVEGYGDDKEAAKKTTTPEKLAEIWAVDPKRVKRILANRQSAARSRERKALYVLELERKVHSLQSEAKTLSAQLTIYQRDTTGLSTENAELKMRLQAMDQQAQLRDSLNEALKQEVDRLKIANGEIVTPTESHTFGARCVPYNSSPLTSPSTLQTLSYSPTASRSQRTPTNLFPLQKQSVPMLSQLPPFHNSKFISSSHGFCAANHRIPEQNNSPLYSQGGLDVVSRGSSFANLDGLPVSSSESSSTT